MEPNLSPAGASERSLWNRYLALAIGANLICLSIRGYEGDLWYWADWVNQLVDGYAKFNGNYPPVYVHWLWLVSRLYRAAGQPVEPNLLLKYLTQIPVLLAHVALLRLCFGYLVRSRAAPVGLHLVMAFCALNPAFLVDGPAWGQLDLVPVCLVCLAIHVGCDARRAHWMLPLFLLALLTKFQMIAFAPLIGLLALRHLRRQLLGAALAVAVAGLAFLPFVAAGQAAQEFRRAYVDTLGQYPLATMNAANLWLLLAGNNAPSSRVLFGDHAGLWATLFTAKRLGMLCFAALSLLVFAYGLLRQLRLATAAARAPAGAAVTAPSPDVERTFAFQMAMLCGIGFFAFLPEMHERYLLPAVAVALAHLALTRAGALIPVAVSFISALNMLIVMETSGSDLWRGLSWGLVAVLVMSVLDLLTDLAATRALARLVRPLLELRAFSALVLPASLLAMGLIQADRYWIRQPHLGPRQRFLGDYTILAARQDHGNLSPNRSFGGHWLGVGDRRYALGFGTHANSWIEVQLPADAVRFSCIPGVDDEVGTTELAFSILGDGRTLWGPRTYRGTEGAERVTVDVRNVKVLVLKVDALADDRYDHADWIEPVVEVAR